MCPDASKPVRVPAVKRLAKISQDSNEFARDSTYKDKIQFHPAGAPVPLSTIEYSQRMCSHQVWKQRTGHCEHIFGSTKPVCFGYSDRKPYETKEEVKHHNEDAKLKHGGIHPRR